MPARTGIVLGPHRAQEHIQRCHPHLKAERPVAIVGVQPIVSGLQVESRRDANRLVPHPADLEVGPVLSLELNFFIIHPAGKIDRAVSTKEQLSRKPGSFRMVRRNGH